MNFIKKIKSDSYFKKLKNDKIEIKEIAFEYLTCEMCFFEIKRHINYFRIMPKNLINKEISEYVFNKCIDYFQFIPDRYKNEKMINKAMNYDYYNIKYVPKSCRTAEMYYTVIKNVDDFIKIIDFDEIPDNLKRMYVDEAINYYPEYILEVDNSYISEYNWIEAIVNKENLVFKLPKQYKNETFFKKIIDCKPSFISKMPLDQLSQGLFDLSFEKNPELVKYFPDQYITKDMVNYINLYLPQYKRKIPLRFQGN